MEEETCLEEAAVANEESRPARELTLRLTVNQVLWLAAALLAALLYPGRPTIVPTEGCSETDAKRYMEVLEACAENVDFYPRLPSPSTSDLCLKEKPRLRQRCAEALAGYEMGFVERFFYYGPYWLQFARERFQRQGEAIQD